MTEKKNVRNFYNKTAQQWAEKWYADDANLPLLKDFLKLLPANPCILDLCCGAIIYSSARSKQHEPNTVMLSTTFYGA